MSNSTPSPDAVLAALKRDATPRRQRSLDIIHGICSEQYHLGNRVFSVATIGRLSAERGGPATQSIRNKDGEHYRTLVAAWAGYADGLTRKPPAKVGAGVAEDILDMIADASVRAVVGVIIAENRKLQGENTLLKSQAKVVVDMRPTPGICRSQDMPSMQVLPSLATLLPVEIEALRHAMSAELLRQMGWTIEAQTGRVTKDGRPVFRPGFATAIKKVLDACGKRT